MNEHFYTEIYDAKTANIKNRPGTVLGKCDECGRWGGHEYTCSKVTMEHMAHMLMQSRRCEEATRLKAARFLEQLQRLTGKLYMLRHENNKLRKANERLRASHEGTNDSTDQT